MMNKPNSAIKIAAITGFLAVAIGAMGAHALKPHLSEYQRQIFETGVQFQFYHTLAILGAGVYSAWAPSSVWIQRAVWLFLAGIVCFSGSLYLLACRDLIAFPVGWAGPVTPLGGVLMMAGWALLFRAALK